TVPVLVATDVAARGIHVESVDLVLQMDPPSDHKDYTHRAGRTARAGKEGLVVTLVLPHQRRTVDRLLESAAITATFRKLGGEDAASLAMVAELTGAQEPSGVPVPEPRAPRAVRAPRGRPAGQHRSARPARDGAGWDRPREDRGSARAREEVARKEQELAARERQLELREQQLSQREQAVQAPRAQRPQHDRSARAGATRPERDQSGRGRREPAAT